MVLARVEIKVPPPGVDWRKQPIIAAPMNAKTTVTGATRPSAHVLAAKHHKLAGTRKAAAERKRKKHAAVEKVRHRAQGRCRASGSEEAETPPRRGSSARIPRDDAARHNAARHGPARNGAYFLSAPAYDFGTGGLLDFDVGGFAGQSLASRSAGFALSELARSRVNPVAAFPASSQFFLLPSSRPRTARFGTGADALHTPCRCA